MRPVQKGKTVDVTYKSAKRACRASLVSAGLLGASAVALGAWGAHAGPVHLGPVGSATWRTAVDYHALHALALLGTAGVQAAGTGGRALRWASVAFGVGVLGFSGSLYVLALGGPRWLGPVTPLGGLALVAGWLALAWAGLPAGRVGTDTGR